RRRLRIQTKEVKQFESSAMAVVQEALSALRVVKAFGREDHEQNRYVRHSTDGMRARISLGLVQGSYSMAIGLVSAVGTAAALWFGVRRGWAGGLTFGDLLLLMSYLGQLYEPLRTIGRKSASLQGNLVSAERAFAVLDHNPDVIE